MRVDGSGSERQNAAVAVALGNHQTVTIEIVVAARMVLVFAQETHSCKNGEVEVLLFGELEKLIAKLRTVS